MRQALLEIFILLLQCFILFLERHNTGVIAGRRRAVGTSLTFQAVLSGSVYMVGTTVALEMLNPWRPSPQNIRGGPAR